MKVAFKAVPTCIALFLIVLGFNPVFAVSRHITHTRSRSTSITIDAFRVFTAGHFERIRGLWEFHALHCCRRHIAKGHTAPTKKVGGAWQNMKRGYTALKRFIKTRVLWPDTMLSIDFGCNRRGDFVTVTMGMNAGRRIIAKMGMNIDNARGYKTACRIHHSCPVWRFDIWANRCDTPVCNQNMPCCNLITNSINDLCITDKCRHRRHGLVG